MRRAHISAAISILLAVTLATSVSSAFGEGRIDGADKVATPDGRTAAGLFGLAESPNVSRVTAPVPGWVVTTPERTIGYIASTWEITGSVGYSGQPVDIQVAVTRDARIAGARLVRHNEPILTLGLSDEDIAAFVSGFSGIDLKQTFTVESAADTGVPDVISRATVSSGVMRDAILRTARAVAAGHGLIGGAAIDRVGYREMSWSALVSSGSIARRTVTLDEARTALAGAKTPPPSGDAPFLDLSIALMDPPSIGRNLLGQHLFSQVAAALGPSESALFLASRGLHSHRGTAWQRSGVFDRIAIVQNGQTFQPTAEGYVRIDALAPADAPDFKERSVFRLPADGFDPTRPFRVVVTATRDTDDGVVQMTIPLDYTLPREFVRASPSLSEAVPLWVSAWQNKRAEIVGVCLMLTVLAGILFFQEAFVRRPELWRWGRIGFLTVTLVWLGWVAGGQLSVVQVIAFVHSLLGGFRWETFLIEPVIFLLWSFVALGLLFWGRGVYCGWLCPFGALQEITNEIAQRLGVPQISVPFGLHERLWAIKYTLFVAILALSFYSMEQTLLLAEVEPFKTAMSMRFLRAWPFVLFVVVLLIAGLFIERFYCRYLCALGAGLAIPAKLKLFDWLRRRPQCGRECRLCEQKCTVGAIDPIGRINPNECVLCLRCQMIFHDSDTCTILKGRRTRAARATPAVSE